MYVCMYSFIYYRQYRSNITDNKLQKSDKQFSYLLKQSKGYQ